MAQPTPVELVYPDQDHSDSLGDYGQYYQFDRFDHPSALSQQPDTLGASAPAPDPSSSVNTTDAIKGYGVSSTHDHDQDPELYGHDTGHGHGHGHESEQQQQQPPSQLQPQAQAQPQSQPPVSPAQSQLPPAIGPDGLDYGHDHQGPGLSSQPVMSTATSTSTSTSATTTSTSPSSFPSQSPSQSQPYRPESVPTHARSPPLHSPRSTRSHSLAASLVSLGSQSPIRRKPLSPTASPLAVRFSTKSSHMSPLGLNDPEQPDSGFFSLNSPDLYELSHKGEDLAPGPSLLSTPLEEQSDQE